MDARRLLPLLLLIPLVSRPAAELRLEPDEQNVTAGRLVGRWERDPLVGERLGLAAPRRAEELEFAPGEDFLHLIPAEMAKYLEGLRIYELGTATFRQDGRVTSSGPYVLTAMPSGNPHLVFFRERDGKPLADGESANVFVAPGKAKEHDLLLLGGDFDNEPFRPFRRVKERE